MKFKAYGHPNIRSTHKNTFEFTKDKELTVNGDCIIGVNADFDVEELKIILENEKLEIIVTVGADTVVCKAVANPYFKSEHEIVVRKTDYLSDRTLGINADKVATDFLFLLAKLQDPNQEIFVEIKWESDYQERRSKS